MRASRILALVVCARWAASAASPGAWKSMIRFRPSSFAWYIAWSAASSTASEPAAPWPPNIVIPTLIEAGVDLRRSSESPSATCARRSSPSCSAPAVSVCGISTANSSPESRATRSVARTRSRRIVGDAADQPVARLVAKLVVDLLEAVDVDHHHRAAAAVAGA